MIGVLPVDKPEGPTSHDVVAMARRALKTRRIGHTGTLDPFATGLLLLCIGATTRLAEYLTGLDKTYEAVARLGVTTDTLDHTGEVTGRSDSVEQLTPAAIREAFEDQQGRRLQAPPAYSAKKIGGRRAYDLAREGVAVAPDPVEVEIQEIAVIRQEGPEVTFRLRASSGTYVRAVARDAGETLGVGAHLVQLRRTRIGAFDVSAAVPVSRLDDDAAVRAALLAPLASLRHLPVVDVDELEAGRVRHGQALDGRGRAPVGLVALAADHELLAVAESDGARLRPRKVFT